jgi:integrase
MAKRRSNNEGSITKRKDGRWMARVLTGYNDQGAPIRKAVYGKSEKEVKEKLTEIMYKRQTGTYKEPSKTTVSQWLDNWLDDYMKPSLRPTTWANYETQIRVHIKPAIGNLKLSQLQTGHLQRLYNSKIDANMSPKTVKNIHTVIHAALHQAILENLIINNPADAVKLPKSRQKEMATLDNNGLKKFFTIAAESKYYGAYLLALSTGLRRGELLALRWSDVDLNKRTITVRQSLSRVKGGLIFQEPKTPLSQRTISIPKEVVWELRKIMGRQSNVKQLDKKIYDDKYDLVFCTEIGKPLDPSTFTRAFQRDLLAAGLPKLRFHDIRHTFATISLQEGVSVRAVQEALGHYSPAFTMTVYSHVTEQMKKEHNKKIGALISSLTK